MRALSTNLWPRKLKAATILSFGPMVELPKSLLALRFGEKRLWGRTQESTSYLDRQLLMRFAYPLKCLIHSIVLFIADCRAFTVVSVRQHLVQSSYIERKKTRAFPIYSGRDSEIPIYSACCIYKGFKGAFTCVECMGLAPLSQFMLRCLEVCIQNRSCFSEVQPY